MVFVADRIPAELARIVEFLNEQMRPAEVLAIEIEHFVGASGERILLPRLLGATERARSAKAISPPRHDLPEEEWFAELEAKFGSSSRQAAERIVEWIRSQGVRVEMTNSQDSLVARVDQVGGRPAWPISIRRSSGRLEVPLQNLANSKAYSADGEREILLNDLRSLGSETLRANDNLRGWPSIALDELNGALWAKLQPILLEICDRIRSS